MKPIPNFDKIQAYMASTQLPIGGYVLKILDVRYDLGQNGTSDRIVVAFDITEGDYAGFFKKKYEADMNEDKKWKGTTTLYAPKEDGSKQDEWTARKLKTFTNALEDSNTGYKWDWEENKWKGLIVGGVFGEVFSVIDGHEIKYTTFKGAYSADNIRSGNFKIPKTQYKNGATGRISASDNDPMSEGFMKIPDNLVDERLPF